MDPRTTQHRLVKASVDCKASEAAPARRLFVGGLVPEVTESHLYDYFRKFGVLTECEIPKTIRGKKKKFGYVSFMRDCDAETTLRISNHEILGSHIQLEFALSTVEIFHEQLRKSKCKLFVSGDLIASLDPAVIYREISAFGHVEKVKKLRTDKKSFNSCFVTMKTVSDAEFLLQQKSLVLPILQKVTFKRFVPRGRSEHEEMHDPSGSMGYAFGSSEGLEAIPSTESKIQTLLPRHPILKQDAQHTAVKLRRGLSIALNTSEFTHKQANTVGTSHTIGSPPQAKLISLEAVDLLRIQNSEHNLRYNISISRPVFTYKGVVLQH